MPENDDIDIGRRVRTLREQRGWSQAKLAAMMAGVKQQSIHQLEQGRIAQPRFLIELAQIFGVDPHWLRTGEGAPQSRRAIGDIDTELLRDVVAAVETTLNANDLRLEHAQKAQLIGALYELMLAEPARAPDRLAAMTDNVIAYEQLLSRKR